MVFYQIMTDLRTNEYILWWIFVRKRWLLSISLMNYWHPMHHSGLIICQTNEEQRLTCESQRFSRYTEDESSPSTDIWSYCTLYFSKIHSVNCATVKYRSELNVYRVWHGSESGYSKCPVILDSWWTPLSSPWLEIITILPRFRLKFSSQDYGSNNWRSNQHRDNFFQKKNYHARTSGNQVLWALRISILMSHNHHGSQI